MRTIPLEKRTPAVATVALMQCVLAASVWVGGQIALGHPVGGLGHLLHIGHHPLEGSRHVPQFIFTVDFHPLL